MDDKPWRQWPEYKAWSDVRSVGLMPQWQRETAAVDALCSRVWREAQAAKVGLMSSAAVEQWEAERARADRLAAALREVIDALEAEGELSARDTKPVVDAAISRTRAAFSEAHTALADSPTTKAEA